MGDGEFREQADDVGVLLVGVHAVEGVEQTEVHTSVGNDTGDRNTETIVKTKEARRAASSLHEAVAEAIERLLARADIRGKTGTGIIKGIDNAEGAGTSKTTGGHVHSKVQTEIGLGVVLWEQRLNGILEGKVESLGRKVSDHVGEVSSPEGLDALLGGHTGEAVHDTSVSLDLAGADHRVRVLGLDDKLDTLNGGGSSLGNCSRDTSGGEISHESLNGTGFLIFSRHT